MENSIARIILVMAAAILASCSGQANRSAAEVKVADTASPVYRWSLQLDSAPWKKSYNFQMFNVRDTLWTFHHDGNWYSANGTEWTKSSLTNAIGNLGFLDYVLLGDTLFGLGHFTGNVEQFTLRTEIYRTTDLKNWVTLSRQSNLPKRFFYHPFGFQRALWIIGGEDNHEKYADVWNSQDGVVWQQVKGDTEMGKRSGSQVVNLNGKLFLLDNDVWSSTDAVRWTLETKEIVKGQTIFGYAAVVWDNKIWLIGCNRNGQFSSQVLVSPNGRNWEEQNAPWTPRGGVAAAVFRNKIFITGGKYGGTADHPDFRYSNDVWTLEKLKP